MSDDNRPMTEEEFWAALTPIEYAIPFYRLYHDDLGRPLFWTMQDEPGNYIEVDQETYQQQPKHVRVKDGQIIEIVVHETKKLTPNDLVGTCCDPRDVCVVVDYTRPHIRWSLKIDETD